MLRPRFEALELRYGRHEERWDLPEDGGPVVVAGPNGGGKTTLVEGLVRTLYGFDRRRVTDASRLDRRRPWEGGEAWGRLWLARDGERYVVEREFSTGRVRVASADGALEHFAGDGNPGARNQEARYYRGILADLIGLTELDAYERTLYIAQGALPDSSLGEHLLRVASGGHALVDSARREVAAAHRRVTRRPLHGAAHAAINPRELEKLEEEVQDLRARLGAAREAGERRGPLTVERDQTAERLERLDAEIQMLEEAQAALARSASVELEARHLRTLTRKLERSADAVGSATFEAEAARATAEDAARGGLYPDDFPERLARAEMRWADLEQLGRTPPLWVLGIGLALFALAVGLVGAGQPPVAAGVSAVLGGLAVVVWVALQVERGRRRRPIRRELAAILDGVPAAAELSPATRTRALDRFRAQQAAAERVEETREALAAVLIEARALRREAGATGVETSVPFSEDPEGAVRELGERLREHMIRGHLELEHVGDVSLNLPAGIPPTEPGVREALGKRREERRQVQEALQVINQEILERGAPAESPDALEAAIASLEPRRAELARKAAVLEAAYALITDAYDTFRDHDQERLVGLVSGHAARLTHGRLSAVVIRGSLDDARVRVDQRLLELESPPLSYGELHALLLGVRLGAADFLAGIGVLPPLIVDEPFAHLDRTRARGLWDLLVSVAHARQVIVTTQDELLLNDLGIEPRIRLT